MSKADFGALTVFAPGSYCAFPGFAAHARYRGRTFISKLSYCRLTHFLLVGGLGRYSLEGWHVSVAPGKVPRREGKQAKRKNEFIVSITDIFIRRSSQTTKIP